MREDAPEMNEEGGVAIAVIVIGEEPELLLSREATLLLGPCLDEFLEHIAHFLVGEGEAADEELGEEKKQRFEFIFIILARLQGSIELLADILHYHRRNLVVLLVQPRRHLH